MSESASRRDHQAETALRMTGVFFFVVGALGSALWLSGDAEAKLPRVFAQVVVYGLTLWAAVALSLMSSHGRIVGTIAIGILTLRLLAAAAQVGIFSLGGLDVLTTYVVVLVVLWRPRTSRLFATRGEKMPTERWRVQLDSASWWIAGTIAWVAVVLTLRLLRT